MERHFHERAIDASKAAKTGSGTFDRSTKVNKIVAHEPDIVFHEYKVREDTT